MPVTSNYQRRGVDTSSFSRAAERTTLPIQVLRWGAPTGDAARGLPFFEQQTAAALADARRHGFVTRPVRIVPGTEHGPLPGAVFAWCDSVRRN